MGLETLASRSGETVELKFTAVLVAHCCAPCLQIVLPSEAIEFQLELKD